MLDPSAKGRIVASDPPLAPSLHRPTRARTCFWNICTFSSQGGILSYLDVIVVALVQGLHNVETLSDDRCDILLL